MRIFKTDLMRKLRKRIKYFTTVSRKQLLMFSSRKRTWMSSLERLRESSTVLPNKSSSLLPNRKPRKQQMPKPRHSLTAKSKLRSSRRTSPPSRRDSRATLLKSIRIKQHMPKTRWATAVNSTPRTWPRVECLVSNSRA